MHRTSKCCAYYKSDHNLTKRKLKHIWNNIAYEKWKIATIMDIIF